MRIIGPNQAPVVQRIEWWSPKPHIQVRFLAGAPVETRLNSLWVSELMVKKRLFGGSARPCAFAGWSSQGAGWRRGFTAGVPSGDRMTPHGIDDGLERRACLRACSTLPHLRCSTSHENSIPSTTCCGLGGQRSCFQKRSLLKSASQTMDGKKRDRAKGVAEI